MEVATLHTVYNTVQHNGHKTHQVLQNISLSCTKQDKYFQITQSRSLTLLILDDAIQLLS